MKKQHTFILTIIAYLSFSFFANAQCPTTLSGFDYLGEVNGHAYFISQNTAQPADAQMTAEQNNGYLAVINDQAENDFIQQNISDMAYIGLNDVQTEGSLNWINGDALSYNNIDPCSFCNENADDLDYVIIAPWDGAWSFSSQWNQRKYIVEIPCNPTFPSLITLNCPSDFTVMADANTGMATLNYAEATGSTDCPNGGLSILNTGIIGSGASVGVGVYSIPFVAIDACGSTSECILNITVEADNTGDGDCPNNISDFTSIGEFGSSKYFISNENAQPADAQMIAENNGGYLAVINDQVENDFIQQSISEFVYIGLNDVQSEGNLTWVNGDALSFNNINPCGFCNENTPDLDYTMMQPWDGAWSFSSQWNQRKYIVEVPCSGTMPSGDLCSFINDFPYDENAITNPIEVREIPTGYEIDITTLSQIEKLTLDNQGELINTTILSPPLLVPIGSVAAESGDSYYSIIASGTDLTITHISFAATIIWTQTYNDFFSAQPANNELGFDVLESSDGILFTMHNFKLGIKTDLNGNELWRPTFLPQGIPSDSGTFIGSRALDGGYYITSNPDIDVNHYGFHVSKWDENGNQLWETTAVPIFYFEKQLFIGESSDGNAVYAAGNIDQVQPRIIKINTNDGSLAWVRRFDPLGGGFDYSYKGVIRGAVFTTDGNLVVGAALTDFSQPYSRGGIYRYMKLNVDDGTQIWEHELPVIFTAPDISIPTSDGGFLLTGQQDGIFQIIKADVNGLFDSKCFPNDGTPDLSIKNIRFDCTGAGVPVSQGQVGILEVGTTCSLGLDVENTGFLDETGEFKLAAYLSKDNILSNEDVLLEEFVHNSLGFEILIQEQFPITIPNVPNDEYRIIFKVDSDEQISESRENNNTTFSQIIETTGSFVSCNNPIAGFTFIDEFNGSIYYLSDDAAQPNDAQVVAEGLGGNLAIINSQMENDFIQQNISDLVYIGLNDTQSEGTPQWVNGDALGFDNFEICSFCNENSSDLDYVVMHQWDGKWSWSSVWNQRKYIVEIPCAAPVPIVQCAVNGVTLTTQAEVNQFPLNYPNCNAIQGDLIIDGGASIVDLSPLSQIIYVENDLVLLRNEFLSDLTGLDNITTIGNKLQIIENPGLSNLSKLNNIISLHSIDIRHNFGLESLASFHNISTIEGDVNIVGHYEMTAADALSALTRVGGKFDFSGNYDVTDISSFSNLTTVAGAFRLIEQDDLPNLKGFSSLQSVGSFELSFSDSLVNLEGLESLTNVDGLIYFENNNSLVSFAGLGVTSHGDNFQIVHNEALTNLDGLQNLTDIGGTLKIEYNFQLTSLDGLENLPWVELWLEGNITLTDISAIENVGMSKDLIIIDNWELEVCHVSSICNLLLGTNCNISIFNNAVGCETAGVVENICSNLFQNPQGQSESYIQCSPSPMPTGNGGVNALQIYPNPATHEIAIQIKSTVEEKQTLEIFDARGVLLKSEQVDLYEGNNTLEISISDLPDGFYFVKIPQTAMKDAVMRFVKH